MERCDEATTFQDQHLVHFQQVPIASPGLAVKGSNSCKEPVTMQDHQITLPLWA